MKGVTVNGKPFRVYQYDDENTILERFALEQESPAIPAFFRMETDENFVLEPGRKIVVNDVRDFTREASENDIMDENLISTVLSTFPNLRRDYLGVLWLMDKYKFLPNGKATKTIDIQPLKRLSLKDSFVNAVRAELTVGDFKRDAERTRRELRAKVDEQLRIFNELDGIEPLPVGDFVLEETSTVLVIKTPNRENLLDIFDLMVTSRDVPFISLRYKRKRFYKVYTALENLPDSWLEDDDGDLGAKKEISDDVLTFKILNASPSKLSSKRTLLENLFSEGTWTPDGLVEINFKILDGSTTEEDMRAKFEAALKPPSTPLAAPSAPPLAPLEYEITSVKQNRVKGIFPVSSFKFNRTVFADLVETNILFRTFLFFNESQKTVLAKPRFEPYFAAGAGQQNEPSLALRLTITAPANESENLPIIVRITHAQRLQQANAAKLVLSKLFALNNTLFAGISKIYSDLIPDFVPGAATKAKPKLRPTKKDMKTGARLEALKRGNATLFDRSGYSPQCQKKVQPYITTREERDKLVAKGWDPHKFIDYEGFWYACEPRTASESAGAVWPGLKRNKIGKNIKPEQLAARIQYAKEQPLLPCCFMNDMYTKTASEWRTYYEDREARRLAGGVEGTVLGAPKPKETRREDTTHILGIGKLLGPGRRGEMPFNWEKLLKILGFKKERLGRGEKKAKEFYPILRYGVISSPDSFLHCLEAAHNKRYVAMDIPAKKKRILEVREELAKLGNAQLAVAEQNLYDLGVRDIIEILEDPDRYIAPESFVDLVQNFYGSNVFLYVYGASNPNGDIVIPRASQAYLHRDIDATKPSVLILKYETGEAGEFPFQCEIITQVDIKGGKIKDTKFLFGEDSPIAEKAIQLFYDANEVFIVDPNGYEPYQPVPE